METEAFYLLLEQVLKHFHDKKPVPEEKWIDTNRALKMLNLKSKTSIYKLRVEGKIRYSQPQKKVILYDVSSIHEFLEANAKDTF